ncbi:ABC transporter permease [Mycoplasmoides pirum]|uniref:ABC transporter permease n=1 Tax=Mycoplasmoides pirum TaxID=2122 RepID=UPI0009DE3EC0|nr:ABC transporter permease [Mycoplasmoides pirum]
MLQVLSSKFVDTFKANKKIWLLLPFALFILLLFVIPLIIILINAFQPVSDSGINGSIADNFKVVDGFVWEKIWKSLWISVVSTIISFVIAFPFCYLLSISKSKVYKSSIILFATAPIWSSLLIKLVGLKSLFDLIATSAAGSLTINSTYGDGYTIIGICYVYIPFLILPLYSVLINMPKNYLLASQDLGRNHFASIFLIVIPYCKTAIASGITLVLLPAFTTVAIPQFLNNNNNSSLIGDYIFNLGSNALESKVAIAQASALSLVLGLLILLVYIFWKLTPKVVRFLKNKNAWNILSKKFNVLFNLFKKPNNLKNKEQ